MTDAATKALSKAPEHIGLKFQTWRASVAEKGLDEVRKIPGYHDEPIKVGVHAGQRSIRLNRSWRAFYVIKSDGTAKFVSVEQVNNHDYKR